MSHGLAVVHIKINKEPPQYSHYYCIQRLTFRILQYILGWSPHLSGISLNLSSSASAHPKDLWRISATAICATIFNYTNLLYRLSLAILLIVFLFLFICLMNTSVFRANVSNLANKFGLLLSPRSETKYSMFCSILSLITVWITWIGCSINLYKNELKHLWAKKNLRQMVI